MERINRTISRATDDVSLDVNIDWKSRVLLIGGVTGAIVGVLSALFYIRAAEESKLEGDSPEAPSAGDAVRLGLSLLTIMRTITEWGQRKDE